MNKSAKRVLISSVFMAGAACASSAHAESTLSAITNSLVGSVKKMPSSIASFFSGSSSVQNENKAGSAPRAPANMDAARFAIANSTNSSGEAARTAAFSAANCTDIKSTAQDARVASIQRYSPASPTRVISDSTCFADVLSIKIPHTGIGYIDQHLSQLVKMASDASCKSTTGYWDKISSTAKGGNVAGLFGSAINSGTKYVSQQLQPVTATSYPPMPAMQPIQPSLPVQGTLTPVVVPPGGWGQPGSGSSTIETREEIEAELARLSPIYNSLSVEVDDAKNMVSECMQQSGKFSNGFCKAQRDNLKQKTDYLNSARDEIARLQELLKTMPIQPPGSIPP